MRGRGFRRGPCRGRNASIALCGTPARPCSRFRPRYAPANPRRQPCSCPSSGIPAASACLPTSASSPVRSGGRRRPPLPCPTGPPNASGWLPSGTSPVQSEAPSAMPPGRAEEEARPSTRKREKGDVRGSWACKHLSLGLKIRGL